MKKEKEICASFAVAPQSAKVTAIVSAKCSVRMEKAFTLWMNDMNGRHIPLVHQKALSLYEDFSKGCPKKE